jgi:anti-sigma B factor antagonist
MKILSEKHDQLTVLSLKGELTVDESAQLRKEVVELIDEKTRDFVVDLSNLQFIDSQGLETLIWLQDQCLENLGQVRLAGCKDNVQTILRITRLDARLQTHYSVTDAINSLQT